VFARGANDVVRDDYSNNDDSSLETDKNRILAAITRRGNRARCATIAMATVNPADESR
jgi:hypothetical protein